ncbi:MAG: nucleotide sugar dehydrogenase [Pseudomonadota bacterium]
MLDNVTQACFDRQTAFAPVPMTAKPSIAIVGLGYVGAVSAACLAGFGHRIVGVDLNETRRQTIAAGQSPIHEAQLGELLADAVAQRRLETTDDLASAVAGTDVTFVSVGTPTAPDGGCDTGQIEAVARAIGTALAEKDAFHVVVLRCSVPPGTTHGVMGRIIEDASGKAAGIDFGLAFVPEFLREGVAVDDFHAPPKTVIGASDPLSADIVARIFDPVDAAPILCEIETAEMVKYVDNVWHATKVCFANEVGRLARAQGIDGRRVMEVFCEDHKLNLSAYYLKPGFAYGGSCLPKEVRATVHLAESHDVEMPLLDSLARSNEAQIAHALELVRATGAQRVAVLGVAFKPGTDDLRESPALDVIASLVNEGIEVTAHDPAVGPETDVAGQLSYVAHGAPGLSRLAQALPSMLRPGVHDALEGAQAVLVTQKRDDYRQAVAGRDVPVIDAAQLFEASRSCGTYSGVGW